MTLINNLLIDTANGIKADRPPIWIMRQAGRILPQYQLIRKKLNNFKDLVKNPELACEVTLQPVTELGVDAAIIFSDILVVCDAMNMPYEMAENKGPYFLKTIESQKDVDALKIANGEHDIYYTIDAIKLTKKALNNKIPLIGFAGCPFTLFAYMIEGGSSKTFSKAKKVLYTNPKLANTLLQKITLSTIAYLKAQIKAGVDIIQIFDSWADILSPQQYSQFAIPYIKQICDAITEVPIIVFAKGANSSLAELSKLNCNVLGLDWTITPQQARLFVGNHKILQGNLDPCLLYADPKTIEKETIEMLKSFGNEKHIANLGHGVYPDTPLDNVKCFINTIKSYSYN